MLRFAFRNLQTRPLRSLLSLLGLGVAIVGMVGLFSVAGGIEAILSQTIDRIPGLVVMQPGAPIPLFSRLPRAWGEEITKLEGVHVVNPELWARAHIIDGKAITSPPRLLFGVSIPSRLALDHCVYRDSLVEGRFLTSSDQGTGNIIVSRQIAEEFHKGVGDRLRIDGHQLPIVGIYETGSLMLDAAILVDVAQVQRMARMENDIVSCFYVEGTAGTDIKELAGRIRTLLQDRARDPWQPASLFGMALSSSAVNRKKSDNPLQRWVTEIDRFLKGQPVDRTVLLPDVRRWPGSVLANSAAATSPGESEPETAVEVRSAEEWADQFRKLSADLDIFLLILTAIGVTIAVLSIVNTMLMSVTERFIEFGILKANGWTNADVLRLVTLESALLGLAGGLLGAVLGWISTEIVNVIWADQIRLFASWQLLGLGVALSSALGILGGLYPAIWASRMMPMDAIRRG